MVTLFNDNLEDGPPWFPVAAVAIGSQILLFKKSKLLRTVSLPYVRVDEAELYIWNRWLDGTINVDAMLQELRELVGKVLLSSRSQELLATEDDEMQRVRLEECKLNYADYHDTVRLEFVVFLDVSLETKNNNNRTPSPA